MAGLARKSIMAMDVMIGEVNASGAGVFCLREQMKSLSQSIYKGINGRVNALSFAGFTPVESRWRIDHKNGGIFSFGGLGNVQEMKSLFEYKYFLLEESARTSQQAIDVLGPTLRGVPGAELWYLWNPESFTDPMSKEFIIPYQDQLNAQGFYEDDYHLIINVGYEDNPWFMSDESLRTEIEKDREKLEKGIMSKSRFNHIWHGQFNDDIENGLIDPDWFDACIDASEKLGFKVRGGVVASHDPADTGEDAKGYAARQGVHFFNLAEIESPDGNQGFDQATQLAIKDNCDSFIWDCDGMGALLRRQAATNFDNTKTALTMFKGSESPHLPDAVCESIEQFGTKETKLNKDVFRNKRAQNYAQIAERCRKTYESVVHGVYHNPDELISFAGDMPLLKKLKAELCRLPVKPNGTGRLELYTKQEMRKGILMPDGQKLVLPSPNLADCIMMSFDQSAQIRPTVTPVRPPENRPINTARHRRKTR